MQLSKKSIQQTIHYLYFKSKKSSKRTRQYCTAIIRELDKRKMDMLDVWYRTICAKNIPNWMQKSCPTASNCWPRIRCPRTDLQTAKNRRRRCLLEYPASAARSALTSADPFRDPADRPRRHHSFLPSLIPKYLSNLYFNVAFILK